MLLVAPLIALAAILYARGEDNPLLQKNSPPTGTLPLPPVGAELGIFGTWEKPKDFKLGQSPKNESKAGDVQIRSMTATKVANPSYAADPRGMLQVDVGLSAPGRDHYVDVYVSGYYVAVNGELEGMKNVGRRPAYEFMRIDYVNQNKHPSKDPNRRFYFRIPDVLPVKVRAELYQIKPGKPARFLGMKEAGFDTDWKDHGVIKGFLFGDIEKMVATKASFLVHADTNYVSVNIPAADPAGSSFGFVVRLEKGKTEVHDTTLRNIGRKLNWKATFISSDPWLTDRDIRNSQYWPNLKGAGYLEIPPIKAGNAPITKYP